jgi:hypothetical protein
MSLPSQRTSSTSSTFSPRVAARPRVIPLYATTIPARAQRTLSIHRALRDRALFHPYEHSRREKPTPIIIASPTSDDSTISSPGSPLTPVDEDPTPGCSRAEVIPVPSPSKDLTVATAGWNTHQQKEYCVITLSSVGVYVTYVFSLGDC